jgi:hypothetical protein
MPRKLNATAAPKHRQSMFALDERLPPQDPRHREEEQVECVVDESSIQPEF